MNEGLFHTIVVVFDFFPDFFLTLVSQQYYTIVFVAAASVAIIFFITYLYYVLPRELFQ